MSFRAYMLYLKKKKKSLDQLNQLARKQTQKRVPLFSRLRLEKQIIVYGNHVNEPFILHPGQNEKSNCAVIMKLLI